MHKFVCRPFQLFIHYIQDQGETVNKTVLKLMQELKEGGRVEVNIKPVYIFLFKDGCSFPLMRFASVPNQNQQGL
jgi:hypothetical protein